MHFPLLIEALRRAIFKKGERGVESERVVTIPLKRLQWREMEGARERMRAPLN
jgi:hypothetical protein